MGKKANRLKPVAQDLIVEDFPPQDVPPVQAGSPLKAADGHNVDGWADEDIRTYNELLNERAKLEKEKSELEQKSSRHQTQRALLDENATTIDSLFKAQISGDFKFTGATACCLDFDIPARSGHGRGGQSSCKHEVCTRAKGKGVSWMEMDTIKYYHARILSERSPRMQNALRKQRDVELVRVKKDDDEEIALRARKNALLDKTSRGATDATSSKTDRHAPFDPSALDMLASKDFLLDPRNSAILEAAKENEHIVRRIRGRLDKIRHDVNAGRVSPADARVKLDQANSEMAEAERKNNEFRQMILDAEPALSHHLGAATTASSPTSPNPASLSNVLSKTLASSNADAFSQALNVMKGFFSASDPHDVQTAITDLRSVLELNGPMSPILQKSFQALEEMLAKPNAKGFTVDVTGNDGETRTCNNVVEVMMNLRLKMQDQQFNTQPNPDPDLNLDEDTIKANFECMKVEEAARREMERAVEKMENDTEETIKIALKKIKTKAIVKSPIPPLSDIVLDDVISEILFHRSIRVLMADAGKGATVGELAARVTTLVISKAGKQKQEKFLLTLDMIKDFLDQEANESNHRTLLDAVAQVELSMSKFFINQEQSNKKPVPAKTSTVTATDTGQDLFSSHEKLTSGTLHMLEGTVESATEFGNLRTIFGQKEKSQSELRSHVLSYYRHHLNEGLWQIFKIFVDHSTERFAVGSWVGECEFYRHNLRSVHASQRQAKLLKTILDFSAKGICPAMTAIVASHSLTYQIRENFEAAKEDTMVLGSINSHHSPVNKSDWFHVFNFVAQAMTDLFATIVFELSAAHSLDAPLMAADIVSMVCTFVLGTADASKAGANLRAVQAFMAIALPDYQRTEQSGKLQDVFAKFSAMCQGSIYRCSHDHSCRNLVAGAVAERGKTLMPAPLKVSKKEKESPPDSPKGPGSTPLGDSLSTGKDKRAKGQESTATLASEDDMSWGKKIKSEFQSSSNGSKHGVSSSRAASKETATKSRFSEHINDESPPTEPLTKRRIQLKHVPASIPSIQKPTSVHNSTSTGRNPGIAKGGGTSQRPTGVSARDFPAVDHPHNTGTVSPDTKMTDREKAIQTQLVTIIDKVLRLEDPTDFVTDSVHRATLRGVARQLESMAVGHIEMAWIISKARGFSGLKNWLEGQYAKEEFESLADARLEADSTSSSSNNSFARSAPTSSGTRLTSAGHHIPATVATDAKALKQLNDAATAALAEQAITDLDKAAQDFIRQMESISKRPAQRIPRKKR